MASDLTREISAMANEPRHNLSAMANLGSSPTARLQLTYSSQRTALHALAAPVLAAHVGAAEGPVKGRAIDQERTRRTGRVTWTGLGLGSGLGLG